MTVSMFYGLFYDLILIKKWEKKAFAPFMVSFDTIVVSMNDFLSIHLPSDEKNFYLSR